MAPNRRLAALMFTDIVGYTALAQRDEPLSLKLLERHNRLLRPVFPRFHGKEVKAIGDSFLVEFRSALDATNCAIEIQRLLHETAVSDPGESKVYVRIGIHLGDVVHKGRDVFGDSVNVASRVEPLADPGGICISEPVFGQVRNKIPNQIEKLEPKILKNVEIPLDVYRIVLPWAGPEPPADLASPTGLAVLPFSNFSPDPKDEYIADGLTEELITGLAHLRKLRVIARTSVWPYKSTSKGVLQIGKELGVSSILEGSVRRAGNRLRITVQVVDVRTQAHVWAETYDRELDDLLNVQADIAKQVAEALRVELGTGQREPPVPKPSVRPDSYLAYLKGRTLLHSWTRDSLESAKAQFELAIALDPRNAAAHAGLATALHMFGLAHTDAARLEWVEQSRRSGLRAIELDPTLAEAHFSLAFIYWRDRDRRSTETELKLAISLEPSNPQAHWLYAELLANEVRVDEALREFALAEAADPLWTHNLWLFAWLLLSLGRSEEALTKLQKIGELEPSGWMHHFGLAHYYLSRSDLDQALKEVQLFEERTVPRWKPVVRAWSYALSGEKDKARAILRQEETLPAFGQIAAFAAGVCAELGDLDDGFRWLDKAFSNDNLPIWPFRLSPRTARLRNDPRFLGLLERMKLA